LFETYPDGTFADLSGPAALLNIPFAGPPEKVRVYFTGVPIKSFRDKEGKEQKNLGTTDTVVERTPGDVPAEVGKEITVQLRLVALSLHGIFTDDRGQNWEVRITPTEKQPSAGTMTIRRESAEGGTFNATLTVVARMEFTSGSDKRILDPAPPITFETVPSESDADALGVQGGVAWQLLPPVARIAGAGLARNFHPKKPFDEKEFTARHRVWVAQLKELLRQGIIPLPPNSQPKQCKAGGGGNPAGRVAADGSQASPFLLVANEGTNTLAIVDLTTRQVKTVPVGTAPHSVDLTPDGRRAFVGNFGSGDISVVDIPNQQVLEAIRVGNQTTALTFDPKTSKLYATNFGDNNVTIVQYREGGSQVVGTVRNVRQPLDVELSPDGRRGYVSSQRPVRA
jgi:YVTN family beta-propeller protein